jgi:iron-sulfur cluster repair protein YtfE (RIC family)
MDSRAPIDLSWTVNATIKRHPITAHVFRELGVDSCCGGGATLYAAARDAGVEREALLAALNLALTDGGLATDGSTADGAEAA